MNGPVDPRSSRFALWSKCKPQDPCVSQFSKCQLSSTSSVCRYKLLKPAVRHFALFIAESTGEDAFVDQFENFYSVLMSILQWKCLRDSHASLVESFYGLQRVKNGPNSQRGESISTTQKVASLAYIIVLPRIMTYMRDLSKIFRERESYRERNAAIRGQENRRNIVDVSPPRSLASNFFEGFSNIQHSCTLFLANAFPYLEFTGDIAVILYQMLYLTNRSDYHHPLFALLDMKLEKKHVNGKVGNSAVSSDHPGFVNNLEGKSNGAFSNWPVVIVLSLVLAVRAAEYLRTNSSALDASSLSTRLAVPLPIPPVPQPTKIGRGCVVPPLDASLCALCGHPRTNSCASNSGYVFCYMCILPYIREHQSCPVSGLYCQESDIIKLFEES